MRTPEILEIDDLKRVIIRAQDPLRGKWIHVSVYLASSSQFDAWARSRAIIKGKRGEWEIDERLKFCNMLWKDGTLHMESNT